MIETNDFVIPTKHPYGMLAGYENASDKESILAVFLCNIIRSKMDIRQPFGTLYLHDNLVEDDLLEQVSPLEYRFTEKAIGLLYSQYHK